MKCVEDGSPAGDALQMTSDLVKQGRMSQVEQRTVLNLIFHDAFPEILRRRDAQTQVVLYHFQDSGRGTMGITRPVVKVQTGEQN